MAQLSFYLRYLQQEHHDTIIGNFYVREEYIIGRSLRMVKKVRALNIRFLEPVITTINRWCNIEYLKGLCPRF